MSTHTSSIPSNTTTNQLLATTTILPTVEDKHCHYINLTTVMCYYNYDDENDRNYLNKSPNILGTFYVMLGLPSWAFSTLAVFAFIALMGTAVTSFYYVMTQCQHDDFITKNTDEDLITARLTIPQEEKTQSDDTNDALDIGTVADLKDRTLMRSLRNGLSRVNFGY